MANLKYSVRLEDITLIGQPKPNRYCCPSGKRWEEMKALLNMFGIKLNDFEVNFIDDEYQTEVKPMLFGATCGKVYYKDHLIAEGSIEGSNYCDKKGILTVYIGTLESVYDPKK